jgi:phosphoserine phosphatase
MTDTSTVLPSWREGKTRQSLIAFLDAAMALPIPERVAVFDNDGTLWCERPTIVQFDFLADALATAAAADSTLGERPEFAAVLAGDGAAIGELGIARVGMALVELFDGMEPDAFTDAARAFMHRARNAALGISLMEAVYQPMLELLDELRRREFSTFIVSGGGTEFVRAISDELYGIAPEAVVGTLVAYEFGRREDGRPVLRRTAQLGSPANEGAAKVNHIQMHLGRRPIFAAGNSGGDREMMEWACSGDGPSLALLVDHDDAEREFLYVSTAATFEDAEPITAVAERLGWAVASMANDWSTVFAARG